MRALVVVDLCEVAELTLEVFEGDGGGLFG